MKVKFWLTKCEIQHKIKEDCKKEIKITAKNNKIVLYNDGDKIDDNLLEIVFKLIANFFNTDFLLLILFSF